MFDFNTSVDKAVALPVARFYKNNAPERAQTGLHNALGNLNEPVVFANNLLQGRIADAGTTAARLVVNSSIGIGGLIDVGTRLGLASKGTDFGVTLGTWGVGGGPYIMLPLLGPAPPRDLSGMVVDTFFDPVTYVDFRSKFYYIAGRSALKVLDLRSRNIETLEEVERTSIDYYAATRSLYLQYREGLVRGDHPQADADFNSPDDPTPPPK